MDEQALIQALIEEGYSDVKVCPLPPNEELPNHTHDEHTVQIVLEGELKITNPDGSVFFYKKGDRVEFPPGTVHTGRGTDGGRMINGVMKS